MLMQVQAYLFFPGNCEEAIAFYRQALGAEVLMLMRYRDSPDPPPPGTVPAGYDDKVMHASLRIGESVVMASDDAGDQPKFGGFSLSLSPADEGEAKRLFAALSAGGTVIMPLGPTFWSPAFAMLTDRFGVGWMISVPGDFTGNVA
jgi:PhnB protein